MTLQFFGTHLHSWGELWRHYERTSPYLRKQHNDQARMLAICGCYFISHANITFVWFFCRKSSSRESCGQFTGLEWLLPWWEIYLNDIFNQMIGTEQIDSVEMHDFCWACSKISCNITETKKVWLHQGSTYVPLLGVPDLFIIVAPRSELVLLHTKYWQKLV